MPLAKTYKRYGSLGSFGVVGSIRSNLLMLDQVPYIAKSKVTYSVTAALENVIIWDVRRGEKVCKDNIKIFIQTHSIQLSTLSIVNSK